MCIITSIFILFTLFLSGCDSGTIKTTDTGTGQITREFLTAHGFQQSLSDPDIFYLANVHLKDAAKDIGFSLSDLRETPSQPSECSDVRTVKIQNLYFVVESEVRDEQGCVVSDSLSNPDAICTISVSLHQVSGKPKGKKL